jgi:hypothetical protein
MRKVYQGIISEDSYGFLTVDDMSLACDVECDWEKFIGKEVFVRYYITKDKMTEEKAAEKLIQKMSGVLEAEYELDAYSEWTIMEWKENLSVGGHDLISELQSHEGKYLVLIIESTPTQPMKGEK